MGLYWNRPDGKRYLVEEVLRYRPDGMVSVKLDGGRLMIVRKESLVALNG